MNLYVLLIALLPAVGYIVWIGILYYGLRKCSSDAISPMAGKVVPFVTVVIPARNEEEKIIELLDDLIHQDYGLHRFEVIVVDDQSEDLTATLVAEFASSHPTMNLLLIGTSGDSCRPKKDAIAGAVAIAKGEFLMTTDADCSVGPTWITSMMSVFSDDKVDLVAGMVRIYPASTLFQKMQSLEFLSLIASGFGMAGVGRPILANGANLAFTRTAYQMQHSAKQLHQIASGDDIELLMAVKRQNPKGIRYCDHPGAIVDTAPMPGILAFLQQRVRWASKAKGSYDVSNTITAIWVFLYQFLLLASFITAFFYPVFWIVCSILWVSKLLADFPLLLLIAGRTVQRRLLWIYPFVQLLYPVYVIGVAVIALTGRYQWKGRRYFNQ